MKSELFLVSYLLLLLFCLSIARFVQPELKASDILPVHDINTGLSYATIQDAINSNETVNGDTIEVDSGIYYGPIDVNKSLTLVGENENSTILDGNGTGMPIGAPPRAGNMHAIVVLDANGISLINFTIRNAGLGNVYPINNLDACVSCIGEHDIDIENNTLQNAGGGIVGGYGVSSIIINNNTIFNSTGLAIDIGGGESPTATNVTITNNTIYDCATLGAINLDGDQNNCTVANNTILSCYQGIIMGENGASYIAPVNVTVSDNFIQDCSVLGIRLSGNIYNSTILDNTVKDCNDGISLGYGEDELAPYNNLIEGNILSNNNYTNLLYWGQTDIGDTQASYTNTFRENNLTNAQSFNVVIWGWDLGAFMQNIDTSNIANNQKIYYLTNLSNVNLDPSNLPDAGSLTLVNCTDVTVKDFNFSQNMDGLLLAGSTGCTLTNITVANNQIYFMNDMNTDEVAPDIGSPVYGGLSLVYSTNNTIRESTMYNNTCGVWLCWSNGNNFYDNAFINNNYQVSNGISSFSPSLSSCNWNNTVEGNYWSDYNGSDVRRDGIGDTPYIVNSSNIDYYPLMGLPNSFNVTSECSVETVCNSTISDFQFNGTAISFNATGENGTTGFCRISIPRALINGTLRVFVNGTNVSYTLLPESNSIQSCLYFTYHHSTEQVTISLPEFPSFPILIVFAAATLMATTAFRRRRTNTCSLD